MVSSGNMVVDVTMETQEQSQHIDEHGRCIHLTTLNLINFKILSSYWIKNYCIEVPLNGIILIIRGATALTKLGRLSSRRWQSSRLHQTVLG
jgi:hypothetical protein